MARHDRAGRSQTGLAAPFDGSAQVVSTCFLPGGAGSQSASDSPAPAHAIEQVDWIRVRDRPRRSRARSNCGGRRTDSPCRRTAIEGELLDALLLEIDLRARPVGHAAPVVERPRQQIDAPRIDRLRSDLSLQRRRLVEGDLPQAPRLGGPLEDARPSEAAELPRESVVDAVFVLEALDELVARREAGIAARLNQSLGSTSQRPSVRRMPVTARSRREAAAPSPGAERSGCSANNGSA